MDYYDVTVVSTNRLARLYQCSAEKLLWNYLKHQRNFVEGIHYYELTSQEFIFYEKRYPREFVDDSSPYLWTLEGMYKHAQLLTGADAWSAYMNFVYYHFSHSEELKQAVSVLKKAQKRIEKIYLYNSCEKECFKQ